MAEAAKAAPEPVVPKMVTWNGEDDLHFIMQYGENGELEKVPTAGPSFLLWAKLVRFDKGVPKLIDPSTAKGGEERVLLEHILKKTPNMARFTVEDVEGEGEGDGEGDEADPSPEDGEMQQSHPHRAPGHHAPGHKRKRK